MPALTILVGVDLDIAVRCIRNADETGIIIMERSHD